MSDITFLLAEELIITILVVFMISIFVANMAVIVKIGKKMQRFTVAYIYIISLSVSDMLVGFVVCSFTLVGGIGVKIHHVWCGVTGFLELSLFGSGILSLLAITWDRYKAVLKAETYRPTIQSTLKIIAIVWVVSFLYGLRFFLQIEVEKHLHNENEGKIDHVIQNRTNSNTTISVKHQRDADGTDFNVDGTTCSFFVEDRKYDVIFRFIDIIILFMIPLTLMTLMYKRIIKYINSLTSLERPIINRKKKVTKMLIICIAVFCICWMPFYFQDIIFDLNELNTGEENNRDVENIIRYLCAFLVLLNGVINPIIYGYYSNSFRKDLESFAATPENINLPLI